MDNTKRYSQATDGDADLSAALSKINLIESILGQDADIPSEVTFHLSLAETLALFPPRYVKETPSGPAAAERVSITMDDLFAQLSKGKATMSVAKLAFFVPSHLLEREAFSDTTTLLTLPLPAIIKAVGMDKLKGHLAKKVRRYRIDDIEDPFAKIFNRPAGAEPRQAPPAATPAEAEPVEPVAAPAPAVAAKPEPTPVPPVVPAPAPVVEIPIPAPIAEIPTPAPAPEKAAPAKPKRRPVAALRPELMAPEVEFHELPGNVNINTATEEELTTLTGMTERLARHVMEYRQANGSFQSVFDLVKVPRFTRSLFKQVTGMPFHSGGLHRRYRLAQWLNVPASKVTELPLLTAAIAGLPDFAGCVISDKDGLLLAQSGAEDYGENWGAVAASIMNHVRESIHLLNIGGADSVSLGIRGRTVTIVSSGHTLLTVIHKGTKVTAAQLRLIHRVLQEVTWLLTRRAYVGP